MEPSPEYWTLHDWLFKAYHEGLNTCGFGCMPHAVAMTWLLGPDWREKEQEMAAEIMGEMIANDPELKKYALAKIGESSER